MSDEQELAIDETQALDVGVTREGGHYERFGFVVKSTQGSYYATSWIAFAIISATGDSFLGAFPTVRGAIQAIRQNEKALAREGRRVAAEDRGGRRQLVEEGDPRSSR